MRSVSILTAALMVSVCVVGLVETEPAQKEFENWVLTNTIVIDLLLACSQKAGGITMIISE